MPVQKKAPLLIAGGGIGGLTTALALAHRGIASRVLEKNPTFSEAGAGIQIGPNGMRVLTELGVGKALERMAAAPEAIHIFDGLSGRLLTELPLGHGIEARHGAPYVVAHRADLQSALLDRVREEPLITVTTDFAVTGIDHTGASVRVQGASGDVAEGPALVAADGVWSYVRRAVFSAAPLPFARRTAARTLIDRTAAPQPFSSLATGLWLASKAHVVHYPVRAGREIAVVVVVEDDWRSEDWNTETSLAKVLAGVTGFAAELPRFLRLGQDWRKWSLYTPTPLPRWTNGKVALLGDAAHPVLPFLAQGGVLAIEDAAVLAECVSQQPTDLASALLTYERLRQPRAAKVQAASERNGRLYHLAGPLASARNLALRAIPPVRLIASYDWLYGWRPDART